MKIMICGSMTFVKEMIEAQKKLEEMGHEAETATDAQQIVDGHHDTDDLEADYNHCIENDIIKTHFKMIENSDAILVLNFDKNGIKNYIGGNTLMEIGLAYHLGKKIFLLNPPPHHSEQRYSHEILIMQPVILSGDLGKIQDE